VFGIIRVITCVTKAEGILIASPSIPVDFCQSIVFTGTRFESQHGDYSSFLSHFNIISSPLETIPQSTLVRNKGKLMKVNLEKTGKYVYLLR
jgi:hypothetical protein